MLQRFFRRRSQSSVRSASQHQPPLETLESRTLLSAAPQVVSVLADNRGQMTLEFSVAPLASTLTKSTVVVYTAGPDGQLDTADDTRVTASLSYNQKKRTLVVNAKLAANTGYLVRLNGTKITAADGTKLDGEFNGTKLASGNGTPGGSYTVVCTTPTTDPTVRFSTNYGNIDETLFTDQVATTVNNFLAYANAGRYDSTFFHRETKVATDGIGIIQGGGYYNETSKSGQVATVKANAPIALQAGISNTLGTLAMARTSDDNSATSEWYFNTTDNTVLDPGSGGDGYAVFGKAASSASLKTIAAIQALPEQSTIFPKDTSGAFTAVPAPAASISDLVVVSRVAVIDTVGAA